MMTTTACPTHHQLKALTLGQLSSEDSEALFQHVADCDLCRSELETVEDEGDSLIKSLRDPLEHAEYEAEPDCRLAVVKALGALAISNSPVPTAGSVSASADNESLPNKIGEYEIVRPIGSGGMGNVFLARHTKLGREVALKVLASHRLANPRMLERFEAEMRAVGKLSHPNIVTAHDAREVDGTAVLVTEYVTGFDLGQVLLRTGALETADACEIARRIAVALTYINAQGFVHRDVKPSNVMLSTEGEVKLLDLGLARLQYGENEQTEITGTGQAMGTADYVAPEQVTDCKTVDIRADIYSLGCTLFKLLTGRAPFADDQHQTTFAKMTAHVSKKPPSLGTMLPSAPRDLVQLVDSMLAKKPADRPKSPQDLALALASHCHGHDLRKLIGEAQALEPGKQITPGVNALVKLATQPQMKRTVPIAVAIAAGLLGVLLGMFLSIIIVITNPDGAKTLLQLAEGSSVEMREENSNGVNGVKTAPLDDAASVQNLTSIVANSDVTPLSFGILVNRESTGHSPSANESQILEATRMLRASDGSRPVRTPIGTWYAIADSELGAPIKELNAGKNFVLVSDQHEIRWPNIHNHVISVETEIVDPARSDTRYATIDLHLDTELGSLFAKLSKRNIHNQLAIIVNGQVRSAPTINSEIGEEVRITGIFNPGEVKQLSQWLHGGLVAPLPNETSDDISSQKLAELQNNLRILGFIFHGFHDMRQRFPGTSNTYDVHGLAASDRMIHPFSWRVAILPFIEQRNLYEQYRFDQPWDSANNLALLDKMPAIYRSPFADPNQKAGETNIRGFTAENSALGTGSGEEIDSFTDGLSNTLLLVESASTVPWTKPEDIVGDVTQVRFFEDHPFTYLMADGSVHSNAQPSDDELSEWISRNSNSIGRENGSLDDLDKSVPAD